jgi:pimeloyl-ACP methyl ester carboxylesterase
MTEAGVVELTTTTIEVDGLPLSLSIARAGASGAPGASGVSGPSRRILLVHGFTGAKEDFTEWLAPLAELGWEAAAVDLRGHGASAKPEGLDRYGLDVMADDVAAVADALGWDRFTLLGHSMGGMVAQCLALSPAGPRLDGLVLMDTGHGPVERIDRRLAEMACAVVESGGMTALLEVSAALAASGDLPLSTPAQRRVLAERPGQEEFNTRKMLAMAPDAYRSLAMTMFDQPDRLERLRTLDLPVLVLVGEQDGPFRAHSERLATAIRGAVHVVVPDAGHSPQFENPDAWWASLTRFLEEIA